MRIGYVLDLFPSVYQTFVLDEILHLEEAGLEIEIFSLQTPPAGQPQHGRIEHLRAAVHTLPSPIAAPGETIRANVALLARSPRRYLGALTLTLRHPSRILLLSFLRGVALGRRLLHRRVQHLHAHFALGANVVAMFAARFAGLPFSFTTHALDLFARPVCLCPSLRAARFAVTISQYNRNFIAQTCGAELSEKVHVIHAGIDPAAFAVPRRPAGGRPRLLSVGRLVEKKGHRYLVEALAQLRRAGQDFECIIVGEGPERDRLTRLIEQHGLAGQVHLPGVMPQEDVRQLYAASDLFVLPCIVADDGDRDGIPVSLMEAMASGLSVVSTAISGIPELITCGREGLLVEAGDSASLAAALSRLLGDAAAREEMGQAGREKIAQEFDVRRSAAALAALFRAAGGSGDPQGTEVVAR
ncbi:MAG: glycosyltransferase [Anaerolineae bacterium]|nr:glycosyltransferase [Anaerolineae bacterium]